MAITTRSSTNVKPLLLSMAVLVLYIKNIRRNLNLPNTTSRLDFILLPTHFCISPQATSANSRRNRILQLKIYRCLFITFLPLSCINVKFFWGGDGHKIILAKSVTALFASFYKAFTPSKIIPLNLTVKCHVIIVFVRANLIF